MSEVAHLTAEATGETVGEAKWAALRELERRHPGLDKAAVQFEVVAEGERGILGVGYEPARVVAHLPAESIDLGTDDAELVGAAYLLQRLRCDFQVPGVELIEVAADRGEWSQRKVRKPCGKQHRGEDGNHRESDGAVELRLQFIAQKSE